MGHLVVYLGDLPGTPIDAAAHFASKHAPEARELLMQGGWRSMGLAEEPQALTYVFPAGGKDHEGWQRALIQALARDVAPKRVNGVIGDGLASTDEATEWLGGAPGVTGQIFTVAC
jgi:hypothetical protein